MAIRGSLAEAGLPDVLQLLALGQKTGCLSVARPGNFGAIYFERGRIVYASLVNRRDRLGEALVASGAIEEADLSAALDEQQADPAVRLGDLLLRRGAVKREALERVVRAQVEESVFTLFTWTEGTFSFEPEVRPDARDNVVSIDPGALLLEGARRADEWTVIASAVPGSDALFAPVPEAALPDDCTDEQRQVLARMDGARDVAQLAQLTGLGEFEVARALFGLSAAGAVRCTGRSAPTTRANAARAAEHRNLGIAFARTGMHDEATREFRRVLELDPSDAHARLQLGFVALRTGRHADAAAVLGEAVALPGASAATYHALAVARAHLGEAAEADEAFAEAAHRGLARDWRLGVARAALALRTGDAARADALLADVRATLGDASLPAPWYHYAARAAATLGDPTRAAELLEQGVAAHPRAGALLANAAALLAWQGRHADAQRLAERAVAESPGLAPAHKLLGDAHYRGGRHDEATECYRRAVRVAPDLGADVWLRLGNLALRRGDRDAAVEAWERALSLQPDHAIARGNLEAMGAAASP